jgi:hypothetical protein
VTITPTITPNADLTACCECPGCCGDLTAAGQVTAADVTNCQAGLFDYWAATACDCNGDGVVTSADLLQVQANYAGQNCAPLNGCAAPVAGRCPAGCVLINHAACEQPTPTPTRTPT